MRKKTFSAIHLKRCHGIDEEVISSLSEIGSNLEKLNLRGCFRDRNISNKSLIKLFANCNNIKSLDLAWHDYITSDTLTYFANTCTNIESIDLSGCTLISEESLRSLLNNCKKLALVVLFNNESISQEFVKSLSKEFINTKIKKYD